MTEEITQLLNDAETRLTKLISTKKIELLVKRNRSAYDVRVEEMLESMSYHLSKLLHTSQDLKKDDPDDK